MIVLFTHDHFIYKNDDNYYSTGGLSADNLKRYRTIADEVFVATRQRKLNINLKNMTISNLSGVSFFEIKDFKSIKNFINYFQARKQIKGLVSKTDFVIARIPSSIGFLSINEAVKQNKPYIIELVACPWDSYWNHSIVGKLIAPYMYLVTKFHVKKAKYVIYVTNKFLQKRYPTRGYNVNCSNVSLPNFNEDNLIKRIEKIDNLKTDGKIVVGTIGALNVKYKGQHYIIKAIGHLKKKRNANYEYHLVGSGSDSFLKKMAKKYDVLDQIKFIGTIPHDEIFNWLKTIDIYAQPSKQEGLPRSLIEAMSVAVPCIGSQVAGIPELIENDFIFNLKFNYLSQILKVLKRISLKENLYAQANKNFTNAKNYENHIIEKRRQDFFISFIEREVKKNV
jgi:glycosyltransferase involved in cell wall biosynthesis